MKTSNAIVCGSLAVVFMFCVAMLIMIRLFLEDPSDHDGVSVKRTEIGLKAIPNTGFTGINLEGNWKASIVQGDKEQVQVKGPEDLLAVLSVTQYGNEITLHMPKERNDNRRLNLTMTLPAIQTLRTKGVTNVLISGFKPDHLLIHAKGVSSIRGENGRIGALHFRGKGVSKLDLQDSPTNRANLDCEGVVNIILTMAGGELTGNLKGSGEIRYKGEISGESINKKGTFNITGI